MKKFLVQFNEYFCFFDDRDDAFVHACKIASFSSSHGFIYVFDETDGLHDCILSYEVDV